MINSLTNQFKNTITMDRILVKNHKDPILQQMPKKFSEKQKNIIKKYLKQETPILIGLMKNGKKNIYQNLRSKTFGLANLWILLQKRNLILF